MMRGGVLSVVAVLSLAGAVSRAAAQSPLRTGTIAGQVFDSLSGRPLGGATVLVSEVNGPVTTDKAGRFEVSGVAAGRHDVVAYHAVLDSLGLAAAQSVDVAPERTATVLLATPSFAALWTRSCGAALPNGKGIGMLFGTVRDARNGARIAEATVALTWLRVGLVDKRIGAETVGMDLTTDRAGGFYACGVNTETDITVDARAGHAGSGAIFARLGSRRIARIDVIVDPSDTARAITVARSDSASGDTAVVPALLPRATGSAVVAGTVLVTGDEPKADAIVRLLDVDDEVRTDSAGRFVLGRLPSGSRTLEVLALGYEPARQTVHLRSADTTRTTVSMRRAQTLATVRVRGLRGAEGVMRLDERRKTGLGRFVDAEEIMKAGTLASVFVGQANLKLQHGVPTANTGSNRTNATVGAAAAGAPNRANQAIWYVEMSSGGMPCVANVYVDGRLTDWEEGRTLMQAQVETIEIYPRAANTPGELTHPQAKTCGSVYFWTKLWAGKR